MPTLTVAQSWERIFRDGGKAALEALLPDFLRGCRWFGGKARTIQAAQILEAVPVPYDTAKAYFLSVCVLYTEGPSETYLLPVTFAPGALGTHVHQGSPQAIVCALQIEGGAEPGILYDALWEKGFAMRLLEVIGQQHQFTGPSGVITASATRAFAPLRGPVEAPLEPTIMRAEQSNTSVVYGSRLILKLFRRQEEGVNPDLEIGRFLTERGFAHIPQVAGAIEYRKQHGEPVTLAILQGFVSNQGDAWRYTLRALASYFELAQGQPFTREALLPPPAPLLASSQANTPSLAGELIGSYLESARRLGQRTAELHVALAEESDDPAFAPEPCSTASRQDLYRGMIALVERAFPLLRQHVMGLPGTVQEDARQVLDREEVVRHHFQTVRDTEISAMWTRCHGDYHLGQVLYTGSDFVIIDFEGEPARSLSERRLKGSPLRDVAGMLRSFHYAAYAALFAQAAEGQRDDFMRLEPWSRYWYHWVSAAFLNAYLTVAGQASFLPKTPEELQVLLEAHLLEKAVYELGYELNSRPDWVKIPLQGILGLLETAR